MKTDGWSSAARLAWVLLLCGAPSHLFAEDGDIRATLINMDAAFSGQSFQGTFVQLQGEDVETLKVSHRSEGKDSREHLVSLTGSQRELIRDRDSVRCIHARDAGGDVDLRQSGTRFHAHLGKRLENLGDQYYELVTLGKDRVAGRDSQVLGIRPRDQFRYGFLFWVDKETGMPLRSDMLDPEGDVIQKVMFTDIQFVDGIPDEAFEPVLEADSRRFATRHATVSGRDKQRESELPGWVPTDLPGGFEAISARQRTMRRGGSLHHLIISDGLAQISVFIEPRRDNQEPFKGESRMGTVNASGRLVNNHQVTVVGEAPKTTVIAIGRAFDPLPDSLLAGDGSD
jgi:sigma-E factor negative regulatory protein RseB